VGERGRDDKPLWVNPMTPQDAERAWEKMLELMNGSLSAIWQAQRATLVATTQMWELMANTYARMWGLPAKDAVPGDRRFADATWSENPAFDLMRQTYLIASQWMVDAIDGLERLDPDLHHRAQFWTRQVADAMSPTNFPLTNPAVLQEVMRSGGSNFARGLRNFLSDLQRGRISQVPEGAFALGEDLAATPGKVIYRNPLIELIQYSPATEQVYAVPILLMAPWVNKYYVMDLRPENSMFKYLVDAGFTVFAISWRNPDASILDLTWEDYMEQGPLTALRVIEQIAEVERVNIVGYCLGGIMLQVTLAYMAALEDESANTATYFATHQDFTNAGDISVFISEPEIRLLEWLMAVSGGYLDGRSMAATFNMLRSNDLLWRYVIYNYLIGQEPEAFDILFWNSDGTRVPGRVHSFLVRKFFLENRLREPNGITLKGVGIDVTKITTPTYCVAAQGDHIVPWEGAFEMRTLVGGPVRFILAQGGHIAGIINPPADNKRAYWTNDDPTTDPEVWLGGATRHAGSWWVDWVSWLADQSGERVDPPSMGGDAFSPVVDAPGTYVLAK
jgi:polyhydroxyalkanoate synthase